MVSGARDLYTSSSLRMLAAARRVSGGTGGGAAPGGVAQGGEADMVSV